MRGWTGSGARSGNPQSKTSRLTYYGGQFAVPPEMPLSKEAQQTIVFLKMASAELRQIAEQSRDVGTQVLRVAEQLETEAADMERRGSGARAH